MGAEGALAREQREDLDGAAGGAKKKKCSGQPAGPREWKLVGERMDVRRERKRKREDTAGRGVWMRLLEGQEWRAGLRPLVPKSLWEGQ